MRAGAEDRWSRRGLKGGNGEGEGGEIFDRMAGWTGLAGWTGWGQEGGGKRSEPRMDANGERGEGEGKKENR